jgi:long-chain fatty acid transport protein
MQLLFQEGNAESDIQLPAQFTVGVATQVTDALLIEVGARWEDWDVNDTQTLELQNPILGETRIVQNRNWHSTWSYNIGANYKLNDNLALNCGYLYGENAVPNETFEPIIPDSDAHLFTIGTDLKKDAWTLSAAFGYEYHEERTKNNAVGDPVGSLAAGFPVGTANGDYNTDIYLFALSLGYAF